MKVVFCGPPHSGKSVFISNVINKLPSNSYSVVRGCPDGEGIWSNNENQQEARIVRKKGQFTKEFVTNVCETIDKQKNDIILVDVGGIKSEENKKIFKHCDKFVVISSNKEEKEKWLEFGENLGLECIGLLDSELKGKEEIYITKPFLQGKVVGLERGKYTEDSKVIEAMASDLIERSNYMNKKNNKEQNCIYADDLGKELGYKNNVIIRQKDGKQIEIKQIKWDGEAIQKFYEIMPKKIKDKHSINFNGFRANFVMSALCKISKENNIKDINIYDSNTDEYINIKNIPKIRGLKQDNNLRYNVLQNKDNVFMDIDVVNGHYSFEDYNKCKIPLINEKKKLYISGRLPLWLLSSITNSYNSKEIYTFQPGKGFMCVYSKDQKQLGRMLDGIDGIDTNKYFEDKKQREAENKYPTKTENNGILMKMKNMLENLKNKRENRKYIDNTIKANTVKDIDEREYDKEKFLKELKNSVRNKEKVNQVLPDKQFERKIQRNEIGE